ncbi:MAG TPA: aconitase/3-isopropylmalate dehydratase large subunit family protein [Ilumatobacteraceae bacterium]
MTSSTTIEKILAAASGRDTVAAGDVVVVDIDRVVLIDMQFRAFNGWRRPLKIADPDRLSIIFDHATPAPSIDDANAHREARIFAREFGITDMHDVSGSGICHQVIAEDGLARPGQLLVCADSHTCAGGAFNCAARGMGPAEVLQAMCTGQTWMTVPETFRVDLTGTLSKWVSGKDVFLQIAGTAGSKPENRAIEFGGPGVATLPFSERRVMATQSVELLSEFSLFPLDDVAAAVLAATPRGAAAGGVWSDDDARFADRMAIDLATVEPHVGLPGRVVDHTVPVSAAGDVRVDQCFIGSCANGKLEDLTIAAEVLAGQHIAAGVRLVVTPASSKVYLAAVRSGVIETLLTAGAVVTSPACGACFGYDLGVLGDGEVCVTSSTRNFTGRMGSPTASVYMASPAVVAASAIAGRLVDPREVMA